MPPPIKSAPVKPDWDAKAYQQFSRLRQRPVNELLDRVDLETPNASTTSAVAPALRLKLWPNAGPVRT